MIVELTQKQTWAGCAHRQAKHFLLLDLTAGRAGSSDGAENPDDMRELALGDHGLVLVVSDGMGGALG